MPFTDHSDLYGALNEEGINLVVSHLMRQRPSLFNYATQSFILNEDWLCREISAHPEVAKRDNPRISTEQPIPVPGTGGRYGLEYCLQLVDARIDFHPENAIDLPGELAPLPEQQLAIRLEVCAGLMCPDIELLQRFGDSMSDEAPLSFKEEMDEQRESGPITGLPGDHVDCFCLAVVATARIRRVQDNGVWHLTIQLTGLEIVDIKPEGLENALECAVASVLRLSVLPRMRFALDTFVFEIGEFLSVGVSLAPTGRGIPNNPAVENDTLKVYANLEVGP